MPTGLGPPNSGLASGLEVWRWTSTSPLKVSPLDRVAAGVKQIGVAAEDLAVPEHDHAAALAGTPVLQG